MAEKSSKAKAKTPRKGIRSDPTRPPPKET
jgi:hypothetical protein